MATISDPNGGIARVTATGSLMVSTGDDGYPTYITKIYHPRLTTSISAGGVLWAIRAPSTRTLIFRSGQLKLSLDTIASGEIGAYFVRYVGVDPSGGTTLIPGKVTTADPDAQTIMIKSSSATTGMTIPAPGVLDASTFGLGHYSIPANAGSQAIFDIATWTGLELGPGEGLALVVGPASAPIGFHTSGWLQFSEKP